MSDAAGPGTLGTFDAEDDLPRVPVPTLAASAEGFLEWSAPLLDAEQLRETRAAAEELLRPDGPGPVLQAALEDYDAAPTTHSWLDDFWESRYLGRRDRIALNANFFFLFEAPTDPAEQDQAGRAAALVLGALDHKHRVDTGTLPPATRRGAPMTMEQHKFLFSATRIPGEAQDTARTPWTEDWPGPSTERHVVVLVRGHAFRLDVLGPDGAPHTAAEIAEALRSLRAGVDAPGPGVGALTTKARAAWATSRQALRDEHPDNAAALEDIETALFCVALEDVAPTEDLARGKQLLAGDSGNRWFDKAVTFVVFADGAAGINTEHCRLDGTTVLALVDGIFAETTAAHAERLGARSQGEPAARELSFVLTDERAADVRDAAHDFTAFADAVATQVVAFDQHGSDRAKQLGVSPDAFAQLAYQLAHRRAKGFTGATYESIATLQFHHGRTEAMRVVTPEILAFVAAMDDPEADPDTRRAAFEAAAQAHGQRARACQAGQAPEQHLWELSLIQQRRGAELGATEPLAVVDSPGWRVMRDDYLSTSSAPSVNVRLFGFGSTSTHCIGVAYVLLPDRWIVHLSTPAEVGEEMERFASELRRAVDELTALLSGR
ncbi:choline/carnitine O-acyltransferase [Actinomycetospora sp. TBRC 11914]|uniref:choline/carnitine O-acyltransferase n=1 Tax=Actinomycetospora sp. TBRC 11914 TaxID=2729387 RepID=UPI00145F1E3E|nr:choline/carnitine O-acyltransferase [Actinomycetospora sp. TBRC 11914]NMO89736.1 choline/carnitine O-acyltransferase [Actinomycetospora sp. TBRC 11914]